MTRRHTVWTVLIAAVTLWATSHGAVVTAQQETL